MKKTKPGKNWREIGEAVLNGATTDQFLEHKSSTGSVVKQTDASANSVISSLIIKSIAITIIWICNICQ